MAEYRPGTEAAAWIQQVYSKDIHILAYAAEVIGKNFRDLNKESQDGKPGSTFNWFTHANFARTAITNSSSLTGLSYIANTEVAQQGTASALLIPTQVNQLTLNRMMLDPRDTFRKSIEYSLGEGVDTICAQLAQLLGTNVVGSALDHTTKSLIGQAQGKLANTAKMYWKPGDQAYFYYHPNEHQYVMNAQDWTSAYVRGDNANPNVKGVVRNAAGMDFLLSPVVLNTGGLLYNFIQTEYSHGLGYNQEMTVKLQEFDAVYKLIGIVDFLAMELVDAYAALVNTGA